MEIKSRVQTAREEKATVKGIIIRNSILYLLVLCAAFFVTCFLILTEQYHLSFEGLGYFISHRIPQFVLSIIFIYLVFLVFFALFGYYYGTLTAGVILCILGIINYFKLTIRAEPLFPSDYLQIGTLKEVIPMVMTGKLALLLILLCLMIAVLVYVRRFFPVIRQNWKHRAILFVVTACGVYSYLNYTETFMGKVFENQEIVFDRYNQITNYGVNGPILGFTSNAMIDVFEKPDNYSKSEVLRVANELEEKYGTREATSDVKPNVVYVMSEAFFDPTRMENVSFNIDPLEKLRGYMEEYPSGYMLSPQYGGSTCNIEFEALTGFSMSFLTPTALPYQQVVDSKKFIPSVVSVLEDEGYESLAIHPYLKTFFKRNRVYNTFGIDEFISETEMTYTDKVSEYISDESVMKEIYASLEENDSPMFIHSVTMQNHYPFNEGKYGKSEVEVTGLNDAEEVELATYSEGVKITSETMDTFFQELDQFDEPTVVVFWGDHLPALGTDKSLYKNAGFISDNATTEDNRLTSETSLLYYANYDISEKEINTLSSSFITPELFSMLGLETPTFYLFLEDIASQIPAMTHTVMVGSDDEIVDELTDEQQEMIDEYRLIQYDLLIGNQYSKDILF